MEDPTITTLGGFWNGYMNSSIDDFWAISVFHLQNR